jgi:hypothetical protein
VCEIVKPDQIEGFFSVISVISVVNTLQYIAALPRRASVVGDSDPSAILIADSAVGDAD